jgi:methyltransferase
MASSHIGVVTSGPYRWVRHPNYAAVVLEMFALPMMHTAWITAFAGTAAYLEILRHRLRIEENALMANQAYRVAMEPKPRFFPKLF